MHGNTRRNSHDFTPRAFESQVNFKVVIVFRKKRKLFCKSCVAYADVKMDAHCLKLVAVLGNHDEPRRRKVGRRRESARNVALWRISGRRQETG